MSVGKNIPHDSSYTHVSGESIFIDDRSEHFNEVFVGIIGAPCAHGILKSIDASKALELESVLAIYTAKDLSHNKWGTIVAEQPILVEDKISYMCEAVAIIVVTDKYILEKAKSLVKVTVEELKPIFTIDEAVKANQLVVSPYQFVKGDAASVLKTAKNKIVGCFENGGQEHFYLESQATIAYPMENGQVEIHTSAQHPSETQHVVAHALDLPLSQVVCIVKRMGGGFGGKESQGAPIAALAALAALKLNRPARLCLTKDDDMKMTGKRHPFKSHYEISFDDQGMITAAKIDMVSDAGAFTDLSPSILERAMLHADGAYYLENALFTGSSARTNHISNTAFRGFGGPQGAMIMENAIEEIAYKLNRDPFDIRRKNLYGNDSRNVTPYFQTLTDNPLDEIYEQLEKTSNYRKRVKEIDEFNRESQTHFKGIAISSVKFGIAFTAKFLNQGNALVNVHIDGTIQASTGATEMGQGVNTKISQIIAEVFGIDANHIKMMTTSTEKNHNTSPTAASSGTDINGAAAKKASERIKRRLATFYIELQKNNFNPYVGEELIVDPKANIDHINFSGGMVKDTKTGAEIKFSELCQKAYMNRMQLGDYAFYKTDNLSFNKVTYKGNAFSYFTNGGAVSEVLIDRFTGECKVTRADILIDLGRRINPGIDKGQVAGAFVQGMGWVTAEALKYKANGDLVSHSPTTYKIPSIQDTPRVFNINFIENDKNEQNVFKSKAVGEPPFLLSNSVWLAIKNALYRKTGKVPKLKSPATNEEILMELHRLSDV